MISEIHNSGPMKRAGPNTKGLIFVNLTSTWFCQTMKLTRLVH